MKVNNTNLRKAIDQSRKSGMIVPNLSFMLAQMVKSMDENERYSKFTHRTEMTNEAISDLVNMWRGFDPNIKDDPFNYYAHLIHRAFNRINRKYPNDE